MSRLSNRNECFLSWKIFYNSFTDKLLEDEMTKVELHQKVDVSIVAVLYNLFEYCPIA